MLIIFNQLQNKPTWIGGIELTEEIFQEWLECLSDLVTLFVDIFESSMRRSGVKECENATIFNGPYFPFN